MSLKLEYTECHPPEPRPASVGCPSTRTGIGCRLSGEWYTIAALRGSFFEIMHVSIDLLKGYRC